MHRVLLSTQLRLRTQRGVAFYLFVVFTLIAMTALTIGAGAFSNYKATREQEGQRILQDAKRLVIAHLVNADIDMTTRRLGEWRFFPDLPIAAAGDLTEPNYDGNAETSGCATRTWVPGQTLQAVGTSGANARCFGRLPWRALGLALDNPSGADDAGLVPWVVFSPNLAADTTCLRDLNPLTLSTNFSTYGCPGFPPYPWLRVVDERGNLLSDRVAFALILPGPALPGQTRTANAAPAAYLDGVTVQAGCALPCQPGTYNNARYNHPNNQAHTLIRAPMGGTPLANSSTYAQPYAFNDQLIYVTADELFDALEQRARLELVRALQAFRAARGYFPFASVMNSATGNCSGGVRFGHVPIAQGTCGAGDFLSMPSWFTNAGWHRFFVYAVSSRCVNGSNACNAPGLTVDGSANVNALVFSPGVAINTAPFAASKGSAQTPLPGGTPSALAADYLDAAANTDLNDVFATPTTQAPPFNDRLTIVE